MKGFSRGSPSQSSSRPRSALKNDTKRDTMVDILSPLKPSEHYFRMSRESFEEFLKKIGYRQVLGIDELFRSKKKLNDFIRRHCSELPPPPPT